MNRSGPMPPEMRVWVMRLFMAVALMTVLPVCVGVPLWVVQTGSVIGEFVPTEEDREFAERLTEVSADAGREVDVSAAEIAYLRRTGQLDQVEQVADEALEGRLSANAKHWEPETPRQDPNAFYRPSGAQGDEAASGPWLELGLALGGLLLFLGACGAGVAAFLSMRPSHPDAD